MLRSLFEEEIPRVFVPREDGPRIGFRLWDGTLWPSGVNLDVTIVLTHPGSLRKMLLWANDVRLGEAFLRRDFDVEGSLEPIFVLADRLAQKLIRPSVRLRLALLLLGLPRDENPETTPISRPRLMGMQHSLQRDREAIAYHYDVSNEFFSLWLDSQMVYSCAYFQRGTESLDEAQRQKLDYVCRKLRLRPGQRFLDIGCGWGSLVLHAAANYGVEALGITLSSQQQLWAQEEIRKRGLERVCRVELCDYRELKGEAQWDAIASVGMVEHVGAQLLPTYFACAYRLLKRGGVFLNHGIAVGVHDIPQKGPGFVDTYIFPDGELSPLPTTLQAAEKAGFEIRDVESLREHYMRTMRLWLERMEAKRAEAIRYVGETNYRKWRLFMSGSAYAFSQGKLNLYQTLLYKGSGGPSSLPLTREDWYRSAPN
ncbi:SAM-dependent methyltransferase [Candidatus Methylacidithermus pantelleriae]|uniref:Cyclopropane-fatty-acyl-phospholipid synthase n=1 Tax=Candidatus Methylacidithermus pantelleriae TaxID=2744239 RepID=A0A8J2BMT2_9BACT|nr:cyclopropane-fatty-acyl-phospholipid synthase family protein [Candidatus Methylacidithermus pantelleriae]CAF0700154.1 Cyclopropane-fatty-acyl-phospholipid synthase [Candidatus Methylacidithermus pantelleriae]